jgi:AraC-like DNA-binding protein
MNIQFTIISFLNLTLIITGLTLCVILWIFPKENNKSNRILSLAMITVLWSLYTGFLIETNLIIHFPHFYRTGQLASLLSFPLIYIYVRSVVFKKGFLKTDIIHAIPLIVFVVDYIPFFMLPASEKLQLIFEDLSGYYKMNDFDEGWFTPARFYYFLRYALIFFYWILQARILYVLYIKRTRPLPRYHLRAKGWLYYFTGLQLFAFIPLFVTPTDLSVQWVVAALSVASPIVITTLRLFFRPEILYGMDITRYTDRNGTGSVPSENNARSNGFSPYEKQLHDKLFQHMSESKKFLQHKYTIHMLATDLNIPPHQLSGFLNQHLNTSFNDFVNKFRIQYCIERIKNGDAQRYTLEALSFECGFNNRNSFTAAFKRLTGITPSDFMRHTNPLSNS